MTILSEQLAAIFLEIKDNFTRHRQIQVTAIAGDPPEQYRICYHLQGLCREEGGEVRPCTDHVITITLPFGFPHFPPNCKPESPVFHPDFDQAAICLGEFWDNNTSFSELILHLGRMLCGEIYSRNNAFNEEAAIWYQENQKKLPLDTLQPLAAAEDRLSFPEEHLPSSVALTMDSIDDSLFTVTETAEHEEPAAGSQEESSAAEEVVPQTPALQGAPQDPQPGSNQAAETPHQLVKARQLHQEGATFEDQGQPAKALARYKAARELAPDFPDIEKDISRAQYSAEMFGDWAGDGAPEKETGQARPKKTDKLKGKESRPEPPKVRRSRRQAMVIGGGGVAVLVMVTTSFLFFNSQLQQAHIMAAECHQFLDNEQLTEAEQKCTAALQLTDRILFIKPQERKLLTDKIRQLQGLGKSKAVQALSTEDKGLPEWQQARKLADTQLAAGRWQEALKNYSLALELVSKSRAGKPALLEQLRHSILTARSNIALQAGEQALAASEWDAARMHLDQAKTLAGQNPQTPATYIDRITSLDNQLEVNRLMASADSLFSQGEWQNALTAFETALARGQSSPLTDPRTLVTLQEAVIRSKVFNALEQGQQAFANAQWDQAIEHYELALQILETNSETLRRDNPRESQQKISKLMLHATVIRDQQRTANHLKNREFSQAIDTLQAIIETINMSSFAGEEEFQAILKEARSSSNQAREELLTTEQTSYLMNNYQKLFIQNNPALIPGNLSHPRVTFLKKIGNKRLYQLQCSEQGHNRPVLQQAKYIYDPATGTWSFFQEG